MEELATNSCRVANLHLVLDFSNSSLLAIPTNLLYLAHRIGSRKAPKTHETLWVYIQRFQ